jgi:hypothetical protein|tara:strand:- start:68 stop:472 length:405 start_codon:yes stop_codon:yes gene_type:complete
MLDIPDLLFLDVSILIGWKDTSKDTVLKRSLIKLSLINKINNEGWSELYPIWSKNMNSNQSPFEITFDSRLRALVKSDFLSPAGRSYTRRSIYGKYKLGKEFSLDEWKIIDDLYSTIPSKWVKTNKDILCLLEK